MILIFEALYAICVFGAGLVPIIYTTNVLKGVPVTNQAFQIRRIEPPETSLASSTSSSLLASFTSALKPDATVAATSTQSSLDSSHRDSRMSGDAIAEASTTRNSASMSHLTTTATLLNHYTKESMASEMTRSFNKNHHSAKAKAKTRGQINPSSSIYCTTSPQASSKRAAHPPPAYKLEPVTKPISNVRFLVTWLLSLLVVNRSVAALRYLCAFIKGKLQPRKHRSTTKRRSPAKNGASRASSSKVGSRHTPSCVKVIESGYSNVVVERENQICSSDNGVFDEMQASVTAHQVEKADDQLGVHTPAEDPRIIDDLTCLANIEDEEEEEFDDIDTFYSVYGSDPDSDSDSDGSVDSDSSGGTVKGEDDVEESGVVEITEAGAGVGGDDRQIGSSRQFLANTVYVPPHRRTRGGRRGRNSPRPSILRLGKAPVLSRRESDHAAFMRNFLDTLGPPECLEELNEADDESDDNWRARNTGKDRDITRASNKIKNKNGGPSDVAGKAGPSVQRLLAH